MTIEEKAKAYDKAIEKIKYVMEHGVSPVLNKEDLQGIFLELKESEDERIRKELINFFKSKEDDGWMVINNISTGSILAWLEKQAPKPKWSEEEIKEAQLDYWRSVGGKEWHGVPVQETIAWLEKQGGQKWSEEDDGMVACIKSHLRQSLTSEAYTSYRRWLESLKQRMEE